MKTKASLITKGLIIRLLIVGVAVALGISFGLAPEVSWTPEVEVQGMEKELPEKELPESVMLPVSIVLLLYVSGSTYFMLNRLSKKDKSKNWSEPTWFTNPFSGPLQECHFQACLLMGFGLPTLIIHLATGKGIFIETFVLCGGIGDFLGMKAFLRRRQGQLTAGQQ